MSPAPAPSPAAPAGNPGPVPPSTAFSWSSLLVFGAGYGLIEALGHRLTPEGAPFPAFCLASGLYLATLLRLPLRVWPLVAATAFAVQLLWGLHLERPLFAGLCFTLAHTVEACAGALMVRHFVGSPVAFNRPQTAMRFVIVAAGLAPAVGAALGTLLLPLHTPGAAGLQSALLWWSTDAVGILLVAPLLLGPPLPLAHAHALRWLGRATILAAIAVLSWLAIGLELQLGIGLKFLVIPAIAWTAVRFGQRFGAAAILVAAGSFALSSVQGAEATARALDAQAGHTVAIQLFMTMLGVGNLGICALLEERRRREDALRRQEAQLDEALGLAHLAHWEFDAATTTLTFNDRFYALYGTTAEREGGYTMPAERYAREFLPPEDAPLVAAEVRRALAATEPNAEWQLEHRIIRRDGALRHVAVRIRAIVDAHGRPVGTHGANQDITDRIQTLAALHESEAKFATAFRVSPLPMAIRDLETGRYLDVNERCLALMGYTRAEVVGHSPVEIGWMAPEDRERNESALASTGAVNDQELHLRRKDGSMVVCLYSTHGIRIGGRPCVLSTTIDITARKEAERQLHQKMAELQATNTELTRFNLVATDRELRMIELKQEINELCRRTGQPPRYPLDFLDHDPVPHPAAPPRPA